MSIERQLEGYKILVGCSLSRSNHVDKLESGFETHKLVVQWFPCVYVLLGVGCTDTRRYSQLASDQQIKTGLTMTSSTVEACLLKNSFIAMYRILPMRRPFRQGCRSLFINMPHKHLWKLR
ncbi:hypothetical protein EZV62_020152 [Acer yangbiense]|uniref:Uncharacterized protein n=1 Tax=Acer yangbiense TaxID=1000413 RepID=A0A5C7HFC5_9ROSI|nr:hypothetical protein EZV62_020152 [Acer yangbiense]